MNREQRFQRSVNVLLDAETLVPGDCAACAVGNLLADSLEQEIVRGPRSYEWSGELNSTFWYDRLYHSTITEDNYLDSVEYTEEELRKIEQAFENARPAEFGLERVFEALFDIHDVEPRVRRQTLNKLQD